MRTVYRGDNIAFTLTASDVQFNEIGVDNIVIYLQNSVISYKLDSDEWSIDEDVEDGETQNKIIVFISGDKTKEWITGNYNLIIKIKARTKEETPRDYIVSGKVPNIIIVEDSPARNEFWEES